MHPKNGDLEVSYMSGDSHCSLKARKTNPNNNKTQMQTLHKKFPTWRFSPGLTPLFCDQCTLSSHLAAPHHDEVHSAVSGYKLEITGRNSHYCGRLAQAFELGIRLSVLLVNMHKPAPVCTALFQAFGEKCQNIREYVRSEETRRHKCG